MRETLLATIKKNKISLIFFCFIFVIGTFVRVYRLTHHSLWLDEANGVRIAEKGFTDIIEELKNDVSPPLHYFILHLWIKIFGSDELSVRSFVAIFGILLIPAMYYVGTKVFNAKVGLISAFITSISQFHIRYSQEVRMYSMLSLLGLLSMYSLYKAITTDKRTSWIGYTVFTLLTIYTHNYGLFIASAGIAFAIISSLNDKTIPKKLMVSLAIIGLLYLPWFPVFVTKQYGSSAIVGWIPYFRPRHVYETFIIYSGLNFEVFSEHIRVSITVIGSLLYLVCFLAGIFSIRKHGKSFVPYVNTGKQQMWILCYLFITLLIPMIVSIKKPIFLPIRYSISALPAYILLVSLGLSKVRKKYLSSLILMVMAVISCMSIYWLNFVWVKSHDRVIAKELDRRASEHDVVLFAPSWIDIPINYYLCSSLNQIGYPWKGLKEVTSSEVVEERKPIDVIEIVRSKASEQTKLDGKIKLFFIRQLDAYWVSGIQELKALLDKEFYITESTTFGNIELSIYVI